MSGVLRLGNTGAGTGRSTLEASAGNDQTFTLPSAGGTLLTSNYSDPGGTITLDGATINITNGDLNVDSGTLFVDESTNRVGIGTTTPNNELNVVGVADFDSVSSGGDFNRFRIDTGDPADDTITLESRVVLGNSNLAFATGPAGAVVEQARIDSTGRLLVGTDTSTNIGASSAAGIQSKVSSGFNLSLLNDIGGTGAGGIAIGKSRNNAIVQEDDDLGSIVFAGHDGTDIATRGAAITARVDGTPGSNDMPGRLIFSTTADGASSTTERLVITSEGRVGIGNNEPDSKLALADTDALEIRVRHNSNGTSVLRRDGDSTYLISESGISANRKLIFGYQTAPGGTITETGRFDESSNFTIQSRLLSAFTSGGNGDTRTLTLPDTGSEGACFLITTQRSPSLSDTVSNTSIIYYNGNNQFEERQNVSGTWPVSGLTVTFNNGGTITIVNGSVQRFRMTALRIG